MNDTDLEVFGMRLYPNNNRLAFFKVKLYLGTNVYKIRLINWFISPVKYSKSGLNVE